MHHYRIACVYHIFAEKRKTQYRLLGITNQYFPLLLLYFKKCRESTNRLFPKSLRNNGTFYIQFRGSAQEIPGVEWIVAAGRAREFIDYNTATPVLRAVFVAGYLIVADETIDLAECKSLYAILAISPVYRSLFTFPHFFERSASLFSKLQFLLSRN